MDDIRDAVRELVGTVRPQTENADFSDDASLRELGVSSLDFVKLVLSIEMQYELEYPVEYMRYEYLDSVNKIVETIGKIKAVK